MTFKLLGLIIDFFKEDSWYFEKEQNEQILWLSFEGKNGKWICSAQTIEEYRQIIFYSIYERKIPQTKRLAISEFITRANYGLRVGNFELDFEDGEVRYKTSLDLGDSEIEININLIKQLVYSNVFAMDKYLPGIINIIDNDSFPLNAIEKIEN